MVQLHEDITSLQKSSTLYIVTDNIRIRTLLIISYICNSQKYNADKHLTLLASQFTTKHIALLPDETLPLGDVADYYHNFYLYFGPFPSMALMPFVMMFGNNIPQTMLGIGTLIISFFAVYSLTRLFKFRLLIHCGCLFFLYFQRFY